VSALFICDGYTDRPTTERERLAQELRRLRALHWGDPGDTELRRAMEEAEAELRRLDNGGGNRRGAES
jgi:hypothetical protein